MDHRRPTIHTIAEAEALRENVLSAAKHSADWLRRFAGAPLELFRELRFHTVGHDPLTCAPLNFVEQLNQTFTILVTLRAIEQLLEIHPEAGGFRLALTTSSGRDIESVVQDLVAAEVFAATHPNSNQKIKKDIARLSADPARHRYVFFAAPGYTRGRQVALETSRDVEVWCVEI